MCTRLQVPSLAFGFKKLKEYQTVLLTGCRKSPYVIFFQNNIWQSESLLRGGGGGAPQRGVTEEGCLLALPKGKFPIAMRLGIPTLSRLTATAPSPRGSLSNVSIKFCHHWNRKVSFSTNWQSSLAALSLSKKSSESWAFCRIYGIIDTVMKDVGKECE